MSSSKKPAVIVAVILGGLIIVPIIALILFGGGGGGANSGSGGDYGTSSPSNATAADFDLQKLADEANALLVGPLADGLRSGAVSLDLIADLKKEANRAQAAWPTVRPSPARAGFRRSSRTGQCRTRRQTDRR